MTHRRCVAIVAPRSGGVASRSCWRRAAARSRDRSTSSAADVGPQRRTRRRTYSLERSASRATSTSRSSARISMRVWEAVPSGPEGIFLKRGKMRGIRGSTARFPFVRDQAGPDPGARALLREGVHLPAVRVRRSCRLFGLERASSCSTSCCSALDRLVRLPLPRGAIGSRPRAARRLRAGVSGRLGRAGLRVLLTPEIFNFSLVFFALFLWLLQGGRAPGATGLLPAAGPTIAGRGARSASLTLLEAAAAIARRAARRLVAGGGGTGAAALLVGVVCGRAAGGAVRAQRRDHRRVQLPGRRPQDVLQLHRVSVRQRSGDLRHHRARARPRTACDGRCAGQRARTASASCTTSCTSWSAGTSASCRTSSRACWRSCCFSCDARRRQPWQLLVWRSGGRLGGGARCCACRSRSQAAAGRSETATS